MEKRDAAKDTIRNYLWLITDSQGFSSKNCRP